jgi:hypothetical protein
VTNVGMNSEITTTEVDLTAWLKMVWSALDEEDEGKRNKLLQDANSFLNQHRQQFDSLQQEVGSTVFSAPCDVSFRRSLP